MGIVAHCILLQALVVSSAAFCMMRNPASWKSRTGSDTVSARIQRYRTKIPQMAMELPFSHDNVLSLVSPLVESFSPSELHTNAIPMQTRDLVAYQPSETIAVDPFVQAEVLNDISHIALDLATFFTPATASLRLLTVIGRILGILSDYLPDHTMMPEELAFQMIMLAISFSSFVKSAYPMIRASRESTSFRDRRTYHALFANVGVSWLQFKSVISTACDWTSVEAGDAIAMSEQEHEFIYWLYSGEVSVVSNNETILQHVARKSCAPRHKDKNASGLLGELRFARALEEKKTRRASRVSDDGSLYFRNNTILAGPSGATLLRINTSKLTALMDHDDQLADSIHCLLFTGIQEQLSALLTQAGEYNR